MPYMSNTEINSKPEKLSIYNSIWLTIKTSGKENMLMHGTDMSLDFFNQYVVDGLSFIHYDEDTGLLDGLAWLDNFEGKVARIHFIIFSRNKATVEFLEESKEFALQTYDLSCIIGVVPKRNKGANILANAVCDYRVLVSNLCFMHDIKKCEDGFFYFFNKHTN